MKINQAKKVQMLQRQGRSFPKMKGSRPSLDQFKNVPSEYLEVAQGMENQFAYHLVQKMRESIQKTNPESHAEKFYNSQIDFERAKLIAERQGLGLKEVILDQIYPQYKKQGLTHYHKMGTPNGQEVPHE